jgi:hypothetical protein
LVQAVNNGNSRDRSPNNLQNWLDFSGDRRDEYDRAETVLVEQSIIGRVLNYGTVTSGGRVPALKI